MPVNRIVNQINLRKSDSVILVYGQLNDIFVTNDMALYNVDGIEKILCRSLKENGFEQVILFAPERQLYTYDERSYRYCFPEQQAPGATGTSKDMATSNADGRPLGSKKYLR